MSKVEKSSEMDREIESIGFSEQKDELDSDTLHFGNPIKYFPLSSNLYHRLISSLDRYKQLYGFTPIVFVRLRHEYWQDLSSYTLTVINCALRTGFEEFLRGTVQMIIV